MASIGASTRISGISGWWGGLPDYTVKWLLVGPSVLLLLFLTVYPTVSALYMSFHRWDATNIERPFIGLDNYKNLLTDDDRFSNAMLQTLLIGGTALALQMATGLALALLFSGEFQGKRVLTTIYLIPMMISPVVVGFTARMAFTNQYGFVPQILDWILQQETGILWLSNAFWAKVVIILADTWQWSPFVFMILFSGLATLPYEPYEAAQVDGANSWQIFWYITLPQLRYILLVAVLIRGLDLLKLFDVILLSTRAGPGTATETISVYIYNLGFRFWTLGYASAASFLLLIVVIVIASLLIRMIGGASRV
ncbi:MAG: sugar ABC transporter permease [Anaerolineae bacterium]